MKNTEKFYFMGYELDDETKKYTLLFTTQKATSLYEALKEFEEYEIKNKKKCKIIKILEGAPDN